LKRSSAPNPTKGIAEDQLKVLSSFIINQKLDNCKEFLNLRSGDLGFFLFKKEEIIK